MHDRHKVAHHFLLFVLLIILHILEQSSDDLEVLGDDVAGSNLLHAEHEDGKEGVLHFVVVRVLQSLLSYDLDQGLHGFLQVLEGELGETFVLVAKTAPRYLVLVLVLDIKHFGLDL